MQNEEGGVGLVVLAAIVLFFVFVIVPYIGTYGLFGLIPPVAGIVALLVWARAHIEPKGFWEVLAAPTFALFLGTLPHLIFLIVANHSNDPNTIAPFAYWYEDNADWLHDNVVFMDTHWFWWIPVLIVVGIASLISYLRRALGLTLKMKKAVAFVALVITFASSVTLFSQVSAGQWSHSARYRLEQELAGKRHDLVVVQVEERIAEALQSDTPFRSLLIRHLETVKSQVTNWEIKGRDEAIEEIEASEQARYRKEFATLRQWMERYRGQQGRHPAPPKVVDPMSRGEISELVGKSEREAVDRSGSDYAEHFAKAFSLGGFEVTKPPSIDELQRQALAASSLKADRVKALFDVVTDAIESQVPEVSGLMNRYVKSLAIELIRTTAARLEHALPLRVLALPDFAAKFRASWTAGSSLSAELLSVAVGRVPELKIDTAIVKEAEARIDLKYHPIPEYHPSPRVLEEMARRARRVRIP